MIVTTAMLKQQYSDYSNPLDKIKRDCDKGILFRLNRGMYETNKHAEPCFLAAPILSPSYLSFDWALSYYGLIPERVCVITSASFKVRKNKTFHNYFGRYEYSDIPSSAFSEGLTYIESGEYACKIATKEKAICDSLSKWRVVRNIHDLKELLFEDKRIDEDEFATCDFNLLLRLAKLYKKTNLKLLIKLIHREYQKTPKYHFINDDIKIDFELSRTMQDLVDHAEKADLMDNYGIYMNYADAIDTHAKNETKHHKMSEGQWKKLAQRYCL